MAAADVAQLLLVVVAVVFLLRHAAGSQPVMRHVQMLLLC
jgi:hypothetical protein